MLMMSTVGSTSLRRGPAPTIPGLMLSLALASTSVSGTHPADAATLIERAGLMSDRGPSLDRAGATSAQADNASGAAAASAGAVAVAAVAAGQHPGVATAQQLLSATLQRGTNGVGGRLSPAQRRVASPPQLSQSLRRGLMDLPAHASATISAGAHLRRRRIDRVVGRHACPVVPHIVL